MRLKTLKCNNFFAKLGDKLKSKSMYMSDFF